MAKKRKVPIFVYSPVHLENMGTCSLLCAMHLVPPSTSGNGPSAACIYGNIRWPIAVLLRRHMPGNEVDLVQFGKFTKASSSRYQQVLCNVPEVTNKRSSLTLGVILPTADIAQASDRCKHYSGPSATSFALRPIQFSTWTIIRHHSSLHLRISKP